MIHLPAPVPPVALLSRVFFIYRFVDFSSSLFLMNEYIIHSGVFFSFVAALPWNGRARLECSSAAGTTPGWASSDNIARDSEWRLLLLISTERSIFVPLLFFGSGGGSSYRGRISHHRWTPVLRYGRTWTIWQLSREILPINNWFGWPRLWLPQSPTLTSTPTTIRIQRCRKNSHLWLRLVVHDLRYQTTEVLP